MCFTPSCSHFFPRGSSSHPALPHQALPILTPKTSFLWKSASPPLRGSSAATMMPIDQLFKNYATTCDARQEATVQSYTNNHTHTGTQTQTEPVAAKVFVEEFRGCEKSLSCPLSKDRRKNSKRLEREKSGLSRGLILQRLSVPMMSG